MSSGPCLDISKLRCMSNFLALTIIDMKIYRFSSWLSICSWSTRISELDNFDTTLIRLYFHPNLHASFMPPYPAYQILIFRFKSSHHSSIINRLSRSTRGRSPSQRRSLERGSMSAPSSTASTTSFFGSGGPKKPLTATMSDRQSNASSDYLSHKTSVAVHHTSSLVACNKDDIGQASSLPSTPAEWLGELWLIAATCVNG